MSETPELLPCPFCGSKDLDYSDIDYVECVCCGTFGPDSSKEEKSIDLWNRRATP